MVHKFSLTQQVANEVVSGIAAGSLAREDGSLPSELELSRRFRVSRATVREALSKLEQRAVIIRRHGIGTFVAPPHPLMDGGLEELESLWSLARRIGLEPRMGECAIQEREATTEDAYSLQTKPGTLVLDVRRVMVTSKRPIAYLVDVVPTGYLGRNDLGEEFDGSILDLFLQRGEPPLKHSYMELLAESADATMARKLHLHRGDPLLNFKAQLFDLDGHVVDSSFSYFVPGYFRFHIIRRVRQVNEHHLDFSLPYQVAGPTPRSDP